MAADYLYWLKDVFEEAQVPLDPEHHDYLDRALHRIARLDFPQADRSAVVDVLRQQFLRLGPPGRQLLAAYLRDEAFARRDSPMRPVEGGAYYDNTGGSYPGAKG